MYCVYRILKEFKKNNDWLNYIENIWKNDWNKTWEINKTHLITLQYTYKILDDKCIKIINTYTQLSTVHE